MMDWFRQLSSREQLILSAGTIAAIVIIGWTFLWTPMRDGSSELREQVAARSREVIDLQRAASLTQTSAPVAAAGDAPQLLFLIDESSRQLGLASSINRSSPDGQDAINVSFSNARFDSMLTWLIGLERDQGVTVASANFTEAGAPGMVTGQVRFERR